MGLDMYLHAKKYISGYDSAKPESQAAFAKVIEAAGFTKDDLRFGSTETDDWYFEDLKKTVEMIDAILTNPKFEDCEFIYQSSW